MGEIGLQGNGANKGRTRDLCVLARRGTLSSAPSRALIPSNGAAISMSVRRIVLAFAATFACSLAVFALPRAVWNSLEATVAQQPTAAQPPTTPQAAPA